MVRFGRGFVRAVALLVAAGVSATLAQTDFNLPKGPCGSSPPAQPQRRKGGESFPPLPLPATPLRRTEKKRPPAPPPLVAKIEYGAPKEVTSDGQTVRYADWDKDPGDIDMLLKLADEVLGLRYSVKQGPLQAFGTDPAQFPIVYYTGSDDFQLSDQDVAQLREFIRNGGTVWGDTCFGDPDFFRAFSREMNRVLPGKQWRRLDDDHPLFHAFYRIDDVAYTEPVPDAPSQTGKPVFFGLDYGDRTAVFLSRYDLSCGWDGHIRKGAHSVDPKDARKLGINLIMYSLAIQPVAQYQSSLKEYYEQGAPPRGDFVFAQAKVTDNWDTQPNAIANLLKFVATNTSTEVKFQRRAVDLATDQLQDYPFLYMTAAHDFVLSDAEVQALRRYLNSGGFLLASPSCGAREFDKAFRREIARVLPDRTLARLPADHPVYSILNAITHVDYTDYVRSLGEDPPDLPLEGIQLGGTTAVIYCPYGLGGGWRGFDHPFGRDVASQDAIKLGVNIVLYATTH